MEYTKKASQKSQLLIVMIQMQDEPTVGWILLPESCASHLSIQPEVSLKNVMRLNNLQNLALIYDQ